MLPAPPPLFTDPPIREVDLPYGTVPGVYLLLSGEQVMYVGQSGNVRLRLAQHRKDPERRDLTAVVYPVECQKSRLRLEAHLIVAYTPSLNHMLALGLRGGEFFELPYSRFTRPRGRKAKK